MTSEIREIIISWGYRYYKVEVDAEGNHLTKWWIDDLKTGKNEFEVTREEYNEYLNKGDHIS